MPEADAFTLYHAGSAKQVWAAGRPSDAGTVRGKFVFTKDWSVFDFGHFYKPPVEIEYKDEALCRQTTWGFTKLLPKLGIPSHFLRQIDSTTIEVNLVQIERDYSRLPLPNYLIPFEAIFRYRVLGSLYDRFKDGKRDFREFGFQSMPAKGEKLPQPYVEFTTKLEPTDRNITDKEAADDFAKITKGEIEHVREIVLKYANGFGAEIESRGLELGDGKLEFVKVGDEILVGDVVCTLDEHRILYRGRDLTKEILREYYRRVGYKAQIDAFTAQLDAARAAGKVVNPEVVDHLFPLPLPLEPNWRQLASDAYRAQTVAITSEEWIGAPSLESVSRRYDELLEELKARFPEKPEPAKVA
jgi:phosphoribosylaminoimidazole-succinocarboxamide synthase